MPTGLIHTQRLKFDRAGHDCAPVLDRIIARPEVARTLFPLSPGNTSEGEPYWRDTSFDHDGALRLAIRWRDGVEPIGGIGLADRQLSFFIAPDLWNQGLATEAVEAVCDWLFEQSDECIGARVQRENLASCRVLEHTGFRFSGFAKTLAPNRVLQFERVSPRH